MGQRSVGLKILWWSEMIISIRVLLFTIPVMINKYSTQNFLLSKPEDRFIAVITLAALIYFFVGTLSVAGAKIWRTIHYLAVIIIVIVTLSALKMTSDLSATMGLYYFLPFLFSVIVTMFALILGRAK